ncbi:MAG: hypothetical protein GF414_01500 [Candidatus Altiarchaeales archaeon]|nr:hypothetical protein [Candidatus Altiarchaeales archaeon]
MTVLSTAPMLNRIEDSMKESIEGMKRGAYNYTWGTVNEPDEMKMKFPAAEIRILTEDSLDDEDGAWSQAYMNECTYEITVRARLKRETNTPEFEIDAILNGCLDDLKKLFGDNYNLGNSTCAMIMYRGMRRERSDAGDILRPKYMVTTWRVTYTQDRESPSTSADA